MTLCAQVVGQTYQFLDPPNPATYIGGGKLAEIAQAVQAFNVDTIIFGERIKNLGAVSSFPEQHLS